MGTPKPGKPLPGKHRRKKDDQGLARKRNPRLSFERSELELAPAISDVYEAYAERSGQLLSQRRGEGPLKAGWLGA